MWNKQTQAENDNIVRHPIDSEAWKHLNKKCPLVFIDPQDMHRCLEINGFDQFSNFSISQSIWMSFLYQTFYHYEDV